MKPAYPLIDFAATHCYRAGMVLFFFAVFAEGATYQRLASAAATFAILHLMLACWIILDPMDIRQRHYPSGPGNRALKKDLA